MADVKDIYGFRSTVAVLIVDEKGDEVSYKPS